MVTRGLGHGVDEERPEPDVWLLGGEKVLYPGAQRVSKKAQVVK